MKIDNSNFFNTLSIECGITDIKTVKQFYYALLRTMYKTLRDRRIVSMPDWGIYRIKPHAARKIHDINTGGTIDVKETNTLRFEVDYKMKERFKKI